MILLRKIIVSIFQKIYTRQSKNILFCPQRFHGIKSVILIFKKFVFGLLNEIKIFYTQHISVNFDNI